LAKGTSGAHAAVEKPAMKNASRVAICSRIGAGSRAKVEAMEGGIRTESLSGRQFVVMGGYTSPEHTIPRPDP
jgi:hypothetical protein